MPIIQTACRNLLSNNVAFGTAKSQPKKPEPGPAAAVPESSKSATPANDEKWEELRRAREAYEARLAKQNAAESSGRPTQEGARPAAAAAGEAPKPAPAGEHHSFLLSWQRDYLLVFALRMA